MNITSYKASLVAIADANITIVERQSLYTYLLLACLFFLYSFVLSNTYCYINILSDSFLFLFGLLYDR